MAFSDPISIVIGANTWTLNRVSTQGSQSVYQDPTADVKLTIAHQVGKRARRTARLDYRIVAADPLQPATNVPYTMSAYAVMDVPNAGISIAVQDAVSSSVLTWILSGTPTNLSRVLSGQA
jgi:hypothetical protein